MRSSLRGKGLQAKPRYSPAAVRCAKRAVLFAFDALCVGAIAVIDLLGIPTPAYSNDDPTEMAYAIQAIAGLRFRSAVAGVAFRRSRKRIMKLLKLDENAHKTVDPNWSHVENTEGSCYNDVLPTVIEAVGGDAESYGPTLFEQGEEERDRFYYFTRCMAGTDIVIVEYNIRGNVLDEDSWVLTGNEWDPNI